MLFSSLFSSCHSWPDHFCNFSCHSVNSSFLIFRLFLSFVCDNTFSLSLYSHSSLYSFLSSFFLYLSLYLYLYLYLHVSINLFFFLCIYLTFHQSIYIFISLSIYLCLSACLYIHLYILICLSSICLPIYLSTFLSISLCIYIYMSNCSIFPSCYLVLFFYLVVITLPTVLSKVPVQRTRSIVTVLVSWSLPCLPNLPLPDLPNYQPRTSYLFSVIIAKNKPRYRFLSPTLSRLSFS